ncbi:ribbon-helix-helix protein, CopG family [Desulfurococcaceae archaeon MEX13E-LK6-19]|nr:ribbon-helix-helix protein, CopG family [Desulfurococcaceae archaeon MEX13E-LK6-19]
MRVVTFKIEEELLEKIDLLAKINNLSRSELIRRAVKALVDGGVRP